MKNRQWRLANQPIGMVRSADFTLVEHEVPPLEEGQLLAQVHLWALDPAMMGRVTGQDPKLVDLRVGDLMRGEGYAVVVESRSERFPVGTALIGVTGWQEYVVYGSEDRGSELGALGPVGEGLDPASALALFGASSLAAYFGLFRVGGAREGEIVLVSAAAGASGSVAAQLAKHVVGCHTLGVAGGRDKCGWLEHTARVDRALDYKAADLRPQLDAALAGRSIDVYLDYVGGATLDAALLRLGHRGRVVLLGAMSRTHEARPSPGPVNYTQLICRGGRMEGLAVADFAPQFEEARRSLHRWHQAGKVRVEVDVAMGLEEAPRAYLRLFDGSNRGKQLVRVIDG